MKLATVKKKEKNKCNQDIDFQIENIYAVIDR